MHTYATSYKFENIAIKLGSYGKNDYLCGRIMPVAFFNHYFITTHS